MMHYIKRALIYIFIYPIVFVVLAFYGFYLIVTGKAKIDWKKEMRTSIPAFIIGVGFAQVLTALAKWIYHNA